MRKKKIITFLLIILILVLLVGCDLLNLDDDDAEDMENRVSFEQAAQRIVKDFYSNMYAVDVDAMGKDLANQVLFSREGNFLGNTHTYEEPQKLSRQNVVELYKKTILNKYDIIQYELGSFNINYGPETNSLRVSVTLKLFEEPNVIIDESFTVLFHFTFESGNWRIMKIDYRH